MEQLTPSSIFHVYQNTASVGAPAGLTIEQDGAGDAISQYLLTGTRRWVTGIDNSDGDKFKIASDGDLNTNARMTIQTTGEAGVGTINPSSIFHIYQRQY